MAASLKQAMGLRLRAARQHAGLTQEELAARISRTPESVSNIERGLQSPSIETLAELARVLAMPIAHLFDDGRESEPKLSDERILLESELRLIARRLTDRDLAIAVAQVNVFLARG